MTNLKKTPLYSLYQEMGVKTIDFGGWDLPVQFSSIKKEHHAVRTNAGLFDVSHMGELIVKGEDSLPFLQKMMINDLSKLTVGAAMYTPMCDENGGVVDDLLVYRLKEAEYFLVVNAANTKKDEEWLRKHAEGKVEVINVSHQYALLAIQGPKAQRILQKLVRNEDIQALKFFQFFNQVDINGSPAIISRTGYTGEDGFEIYCMSEAAPDIWKKLLEVGEEDGLLPCGLGARDTLRFEAGLPLYGQELSAQITPLEAGIGFAVKLNKDANFIGKSALKAQKAKGIPRKNIGIEMIDRGIPRHGYKLYSGEREVGIVTSGTQSPTLKKNMGLALVQTEYAKLGAELEVEIRGKRLKAKVISTPFYKRSRN
ncbi:glycine cleavage system aminomethyltransferase GcvT [Lederbergia sp. NSJ-179]|uniref:glycine cleavage system aminomethyltransferase GcvT n=1 Tax=Lederbergia sp. NSJ-179 TaxID=2931402 RepID=UPI001FD240AF|nr:glycine cleavage system aminomethyltransferase GcvT [Lederbergia sp. NSJ-179]MCJ7839323.1 glycine cleavage system aminomethyltransferase GcvT [Lederbergia sp. NSJ-179]